MPAALPNPAQRLRAIQLARTRLVPLALDRLLAQIPVEAARACGLARALLMLVRDGELVTAGAYAGEAPAAQFLQLARAIRLRLADCPLEADVVARGGARLVRDVDREPLVFRPLAGLGQAGAFAVAPLVHPDRTIALLYGDRRDGPPLDELDGEMLWMFATALAPALHLATLAAIARDGGVALRGRRNIGS